MKKIATVFALLGILTLTGCASGKNEGTMPETEVQEPAISAPQDPSAPTGTPEAEQVHYIRVLADGLNVRSAPDLSGAVLGQAERGTLLYDAGRQDGWHRTYFCGKTAYVSAAYCEEVSMPRADGRTEAVIAEGCALLGTPYVYGAVRFHDGTGVRLKGFTTAKFDCSSLMQYIFYEGADLLLDVTTRTQIAQGVRVDEPARGDLLFFTNASRRWNTGLERVGHVALYLGDNYILHTASDFAKIEQISPTRQGYFLEARRIL